MQDLSAKTDNETACNEHCCKQSMHSSRQGSLSRIRQQNALCMWAVSLKLVFCCLANPLYLADFISDSLLIRIFQSNVNGIIILNQLKYTLASVSRDKIKLCSLQTPMLCTNKSDNNVRSRCISQTSVSRPEVLNVVDDVTQWISESLAVTWNFVSQPFHFQASVRRDRK